MAKYGFTVAHVVTHMLAKVENQLDTRSSGGLSIFLWTEYFGGLFYSDGLSLFCRAVHFGGLSFF